MKKPILLTAFVLTLLTACAERAMNEPSKVVTMSSIELSSPRPIDLSAIALVDTSITTKTVKKIIKDGKMEIVVTDLNNTKSSIDQLVKKNSAYYEKEEYINNAYELYYELTIRIPSAKFENVIAAIESGNGKVQSKQINARDVTAEFYDLQTRLVSKKSYLGRYRELLKQAKSIDNIVSIEEKIRDLEEEIDSTIGRLKYLGDQVDFSTLRLTITKKIDQSLIGKKSDTALERLTQSLSKGWNGFVDFLFFLIKIWPLWFIVPLAIYLWRKFKKRKKAKSDNK